MFMTIIFFLVSISASVVGSICGIGGGVIIKPVLDAAGIMSVSSISFLSGCTVLAMSVVSVYKNVRAGTAKLNVRTATGLAVGAALGGVAGKSMFQALKSAVGNENVVGMTQAVVLIIITLGTLIYTVCKKKDTYKGVHSALAVFCDRCPAGDHVQFPGNRRRTDQSGSPRLFLFHGYERSGA